MHRFRNSVQKPEILLRWDELPFLRFDLGCSPRLRDRGEVFAFPITRDVGAYGDYPGEILLFLITCDGGDYRGRDCSSISAIFGNLFVALCLCPSARDPSGVSVLLKTKDKVQFDRAVDRTVEAFFLSFSPAESVYPDRVFDLVALCRRIAQQWVATFKGLLWLIAEC